MTKSFLVLSLAAMVSAPFAARASLITGVLNITGTANVSQGVIAFVPSNQFTINAPASSQGGGFMALAGTSGTIQNLTDPPDTTGPLNVPNFITFAAAPNISFTLTFLTPGIDGAAGCTASPAAAGQVCTPNIPDQSPFNLQNTSTSTSTASFSVMGIEHDTLTNTNANFIGTFSEPFDTMNFQQILAAIASGSTLTTPFSAQFSVTPQVTTPEPNTWLELMLGFAMVGIGVVYRRKLRRA
jgi:hypothetical protein